MVYVIIQTVILVITQGTVRVGGVLLALISSILIGRLLTFRYKKGMEKRLGREVKEHELTSITSWMEASTKEERPRVVPVRPDMSPKEKAELSRKNLEELINTERTQGRQAAHELMKQLFQIDDDEQKPKK